MHMACDGAKINYNFEDKDVKLIEEIVETTKTASDLITTLSSAKANLNTADLAIS